MLDMFTRKITKNIYIYGMVRRLSNLKGYINSKYLTCLFTLIWETASQSHYISRESLVLSLTLLLCKWLTGTILWQEGTTVGEWAWGHQPSKLDQCFLIGRFHNWHAEKDVYVHQLPDIDIKTWKRLKWIWQSRLCSSGLLQFSFCAETDCSFSSREGNLLVLVWIGGKRQILAHSSILLYLSVAFPPFSFSICALIISNNVSWVYEHQISASRSVSKRTLRTRGEVEEATHAYTMFPLT